MKRVPMVKIQIREDADGFYVIAKDGKKWIPPNEDTPYFYTALDALQRYRLETAIGRKMKEKK
jgi:hypothetical protein